MNIASLGELKNLGAINAIQDGNHGDIHPVSADYVESGVPFIMASDIVGGSIDFDRCKRLSRAHADGLRIGFAKTGDVLLTHKGTLGNVALVPEVDPYIMLTPQVTYYRTNEKQLHNRFLIYAFRSSQFQGAMKRFSDQSTRPYVGITNQRYLQIPFPPLPIQKKIAGVLSAYDDLIEANLKRIKLLEEMAQIIYEEWFVRLRFPNHETTPVNPETGLPDGWAKKSLSSLGTFMNGYPFKPDDLGDEGMPIIKIKEIKAGVVLDTPRNSGEGIPKKYLISAGDILFSWSASLAVVIWSYETGIINQHLFKVIPNDGIPRAFLYLANKDSLGIFDSLTTGATMKHIKRKELDFVEVNVPDKVLLGQFGERVDQIIDCSLNLQRQNQLLKEARDLLLPRLMTGLIDIDDYLSRNASAAAA